MIDLGVFPPAYRRRAAELIKKIAETNDPCQHRLVSRMTRFPADLAVARLGRRWRLIFALRSGTWEPVWAGSHESYNKLDTGRLVEGGRK